MKFYSKDGGATAESHDFTFHTYDRKLRDSCFFVSHKIYKQFAAPTVVSRYSNGKVTVK